MADHKTSYNETSIIVPVKSILALRKSITSMKDVGSLITLRTRDQNKLEISVMDHFNSSAMFTHIPVRPFQGIAWVNVASEQLNALASKLKAYPNALMIKIQTNDSATFIDAVTSESIFVLMKSYGDIPNSVEPYVENNYYFVTLVSLDLLGILVNLSVGSAVMSICLKSDGQLSFSNKHEYGSTIIEKQLSGFSSSTKIVHNLCKMRCVIKFIKQVVNHLVNCSKQQCTLGIPKDPSSCPLVLQFLLSQGIYENFLMLPFHTPLRHIIMPGSHQNPIEAVFVSEPNLLSDSKICKSEN